MKTHKEGSLNSFPIVLSIAISSLTVTGVSVIDGQFWNVVLKVLGLLAYGVVGLLISIGLLKGRKASLKAYAFILGLLILGAFEIYRLLDLFKQWVLGWALFVKILVPSVLFVAVGSIIIFKILISKRHKKAKENTIKDEIYAE